MNISNINVDKPKLEEIVFKTDLSLSYFELSDLSYCVNQLLNFKFDRTKSLDFLKNCNLLHSDYIVWSEISNHDILSILSNVDKFLFEKLIESKINLLRSSSSQEIFDIIDSSDGLSFTIDEFNSSSNLEDLSLSSNLELFCYLGKLSLDNLLLLNNQNFSKLVRSLILLKLDELQLSEFVLISNFGCFEEDCKLFFINKFSPLKDDDFNVLINLTSVSGLLLEDCNQLIFNYLEDKQDSFVELSSNIDSFQLLINEHNLRVAENKADGDVNVLMNLFSAAAGLFSDNFDGFSKLLEKYLVKLFDKVFKGRFEKLKLFLARKIGLESLLVRLGINLVFSSIPVLGVVLANVIDKYLNSYSSKTVSSY